MPVHNNNDEKKLRKRNLTPLFDEREKISEKKKYFRQCYIESFWFETEDEIFKGKVCSSTINKVSPMWRHNVSIKFK